MKPFQVNCSELVADFEMHDDGEMREILKLLAAQFDIEIFFIINIWRSGKFSFGDDRCFTVELEDLSFEINVKSSQYYETWTVKSTDNSNLKKIIESIGKYQIRRYDEDVEKEYSPIIRELIGRVVTLACGDHLNVGNLKDSVNIEEDFDVEIKVGNGKNLTTLCYGPNGYDVLGWYFNCEHYERNSFPFYEWSEHNRGAKIRPFDGGSIFSYAEYKENPDREGLSKKL